MPAHQETEYVKAEHKRKIWYVETHLVEHCNINCKYCDHFSCVASPQFADIGIFEKDLRRIKKLSSGMAAQLIGMDRVTFLFNLHHFSVAMINLEDDELLADVENA